MMTEEKIRERGIEAKKYYIYWDGATSECNVEYGYWQFAEEILGETFPDFTEDELEEWIIEYES